MSFFDKIKDLLDSSPRELMGVVKDDIPKGAEFTQQCLEKAIKKETWVGLTEQIRNELKDEGFYCEKEDSDESIT